MIDIEKVIGEQVVEKKSGKVVTKNAPVAPKPQYPRAIEKKFYWLIKDMLNAVEDELHEQLEQDAVAIRIDADGSNADGVDDWLRNIAAYKGVVNRVFKKELVGRFLDKIQGDLIGFNKRQVSGKYQEVAGVDLLAYSEDIQGITRLHTESSLSMIEDIGDDIKKKIEKQVHRGMREGLTQKDLAKRISRNLKGKEGIFASAKNRAKLIARNEVSNFNATLTKARQETLGIKFYEWLSILDDRVRDEGKGPSKTNHKAMNRKIYPWGSVPVTIEVDGKKYKFQPAPKGIFGDLMYPGSEINCRCTARALLSTQLERRIRKLAKSKSPTEVVRELQGM